MKKKSAKSVPGSYERLKREEFIETTRQLLEKDYYIDKTENIQSIRQLLDTIKDAVGESRYNQLNERSYYTWLKNEFTGGRTLSMNYRMTYFAAKSHETILKRKLENTLEDLDDDCFNTAKTASMPIRFVFCTPGSESETKEALNSWVDNNKDLQTCYIDDRGIIITSFLCDGAVGLVFRSDNDANKFYNAFAEEFYVQSE